MRAENHGLISQLRIAALDLRRHIAGMNLANFRRRGAHKP